MRVSFHQLELVAVLLGLVVLAGCAPTVTQTPPTVSAPPSSATVSPTAPEPAPIAAAPAPAPVPVTAPESAPAPAAPVVVAPSAAEIAVAAALTPAGAARYVCVKTGAGGETRTPITLPPGTERICSRHPAMGPCQYERDQCRRAGGRVIRFDGTEITPEVEREYDKQVTRIRLNAG